MYSPERSRIVGYGEALPDRSSPRAPTASALADHPRNLTDRQQIKAIAATGETIGLNSINRFVEPPDLPHLLDHLDRFVIAGREHVGLGYDFCHYLLEHKSPVERSGIEEGRLYLSVDGLASDHDVPKIPQDAGSARLPHRHDRHAGDGENFLRVFQAVVHA